MGSRVLIKTQIRNSNNGFSSRQSASAIASNNKIKDTALCRWRQLSHENTARSYNELGVKLLGMRTSAISQTRNYKKKLLTKPVTKQFILEAAQKS